MIYTKCVILCYVKLHYTVEIKQDIRHHWAIKCVLNRLLQSKDWLFCLITHLQYKHNIYKNTWDLYVPYACT